MKKYIKVQAGEVISEPFSLGKSLTTDNGGVIFNPHKLDNDTLIAMGIYPVQELDIPEPHQIAVDRFITVEPQLVTISYVSVDRDIDKVKATAVQRVYDFIRGEMDSLVSDYSQGEMTMWASLEAECRKYQEDGTVGRLMQMEADTNSRTIVEIANIVVAKADALHTARIGLIARRTEMVNAINAFTTVQEVQAYRIAVS